MVSQEVLGGFIFLGMFVVMSVPLLAKMQRHLRRIERMDDGYL